MRERERRTDTVSGKDYNVERHDWGKRKREGIQGEKRDLGWVGGVGVEGQVRPKEGWNGELNVALSDHRTERH